MHGHLMRSAFATAPTVSMTNPTNQIEIITSVIEWRVNNL